MFLNKIINEVLIFYLVIENKEKNIFVNKKKWICGKKYLVCIFVYLINFVKYVLGIV